MDRDRSLASLTVVTSLVLSVVLSRLSLGVLVYPIPLMLASYRMEKTLHAVLVQALALVAVLAWRIIPEVNLLTPEAMGMFLLGLLFILSTGLTSLIYTALREYSSSMLRKMVLASIPVMILGSVYIIWLGTASGVVAAEGIRAIFAAVFTDEILGFDTAMFAEVALLIVKLVAVPFSMIFGAIPVLVTESGANRFNSEWQANFASMMMPPVFFWVFCGLLAVTVAGYFAKSQTVTLIGINLTAGLGLHYVLNGLSVVHAWVRSKNQGFAASTLIYTLFFLSFIPFLGGAVWLALLVTGLLERWVKMR
jgi:hypothetical protein